MKAKHFVLGVLLLFGVAVSLPVHAQEWQPEIFKKCKNASDIWKYCDLQGRVVYEITKTSNGQYLLWNHRKNKAIAMGEFEDVLVAEDDGDVPKSLGKRFQKNILFLYLKNQIRIIDDDGNTIFEDKIDINPGKFYLWENNYIYLLSCISKNVSSGITYLIKNNNEIIKLSEYFVYDGNTIVPFIKSNHNNKYGVIDGKLKIILPVEYDKIEELNEKWIRVVKDGKVGIYDTRKADFVLSPQYDEIYNLNDVKETENPFWFVVKKDGNWGIVSGEFKNMDPKVLNAENKIMYLPFRYGSIRIPKKIYFKLMEFLTHVVNEMKSTAFNSTGNSPDSNETDSSDSLLGPVMSAFIEAASKTNNRRKYERGETDETLEIMMVLMALRSALGSSLVFGQIDGKWTWQQFFAPNAQPERFDDFQYFLYKSGGEQTGILKIQNGRRYGILQIFADQSPPPAKGHRETDSISLVGLKVLDPEYDDIRIFQIRGIHFPFFLVKKAGKQGIYFGTQKQPLVPLDFTSIEGFQYLDEVTAAVAQNGEWSIVVRQKVVSQQKCSKAKLFERRSDGDEVIWGCQKPNETWEILSTKTNGPVSYPSASFDVQEMEDIPEEELVYVTPEPYHPSSSSSRHDDDDEDSEDDEDESKSNLLEGMLLERLGKQVISPMTRLPVTAFQNVSEIFAGTPGLYMEKTHPAGGAPILFGPGRSQRVLIDGIPFAALQIRPTVMNSLHLFEPMLLENVSVVHGANPVVFGSPAVNGVLQINPISTFTPKKENSLLRLYGGYRNIDSGWWMGIVQAYQSPKGGMAYGLTGSRGNDLRGGEDTGVQEDTASKLFNGFLNFSFTHESDTFSYFRITFAYLFGNLWDANRSQPSFSLRNELQDKLHLVWSKFEFGLPSPKMDFMLQIAYQRFYEQQDDWSSPRTRNQTTLSSPLLNARFSWRFSRRTTLFAGLLGQAGSIDSSHYEKISGWTKNEFPTFPKNTSFSETGLFTAISYQWLQKKNWSSSLHAGARAENMSVLAPSIPMGDKVDYQMQGVQVSTGIDLNYKKYSSSLFASRGTRMPTLFESAYYGHYGSIFHLPNPELTPETITSLEWRGQARFSRLQILAGAFRAIIRDPILSNQTGMRDGLLEWQDANGDTGSYDGVMAALDWSVNRHLAVKGFAQKIRGKMADSQGIFAGGPDSLPLYAQVSLHAFTKNWVAEASLRAMGTAAGYDEANCAADHPSNLCWYTVNFRGGGIFKDFKFFMSVENLMNQKYIPYLWNYYAPGLTFMIHFILG